LPKVLRIICSGNYALILHESISTYGGGKRRSDESHAEIEISVVPRCKIPAPVAVVIHASHALRLEEKLQALPRLSSNDDESATSSYQAIMGTP
jgi:hypothetical protein